MVTFPNLCNMQDTVPYTCQIFSLFTEMVHFFNVRDTTVNKIISSCDKFCEGNQSHDVTES